MGESVHLVLAKIGANLRTIRKGKKMTQVVLAEKAGVSRGYISQIENGNENIGLATLQEIANALGVELKEIVALGEFPGNAEMTRLVDLAEGKPGRDVWVRVRYGI